MSGYIGTQPVPQATQTRDSFTCTAGQTSFATSGFTPNFLDVYLNGVKLAATDYTASNGSDVVLASGAAAGDVLEVVAYTAFEAANVTGATDFTVTGSFTSQGIDDNATSTAITLDGSGNLLVGKTSADSGATDGLELTSNGRIYTSANGLSSMILNRRTTDGNLAQFKKDGTTVGSIGIQSSGFYIDGESGHAGVRFAGDAIVPRDGGADTNGTTNIGAINNKWQDLYLSGGIYLGGVGSSNKLDDYEEGTWTPTFNSFGSGSVYAVQYGYYKKIGQLVVATCYIQLSTNTGSGSLRVNGLPYASASVTNNYGSTSAVHGTSWFTPTPGLQGLISSGQTAVQFYRNMTTTNSPSDYTVSMTEIGLGNLLFNVTYFTS